MKKKYIASEMEITEFDVEDVIQSSVTGQAGNEDGEDIMDDDQE